MILLFFFFWGYSRWFSNASLQQLIRPFREGEGSSTTLCSFPLKIANASAWFTYKDIRINIIYIYMHLYIYLDLPYGTYFCRCSKTLELSPFLRKNAVPENRCRCEKLSAHVVGYFRRWKTGLAAILWKRQVYCGMQGSTNSNERCYGFLHTLNQAVSLQILLTKPVKAQGLLIPKSGSRPQHPRMYLANGNGTWEIHTPSCGLIAAANLYSQLILSFHATSANVGSVQFPCCHQSQAIWCEGGIWQSQWPGYHKVCQHPCHRSSPTIGDILWLQRCAVLRQPT